MMTEMWSKSTFPNPKISSRKEDEEDDDDDDEDENEQTVEI